MKINEIINTFLEGDNDVGEYAVYVRDKIDDTCTGIYIIALNEVSKNKYRKITKSKKARIDFLTTIIK